MVEHVKLWNIGTFKLTFPPLHHLSLKENQILELIRRRPVVNRVNMNIVVWDTEMLIKILEMT